MPTFQITNTATLQSVVDECCKLLSLTPQVSAMDATDPAIVLLVSQANLANAEIATAYEWPELVREGEITVFTNDPPNPSFASEVSYPLPQDFYRFVDQTQWNTAMRYPAAGPVSSQGWMTYLVFPVSANFTLTWQVRDGRIWFLNPPASPGQVFKFMYMTKAYIRDADATDVYKNIATKNGDVFILDPLLIVHLTRMKWLEAKGFDSSAAARDFATAWDARAGASKGANIINMAGRSGAFPLLNTGNLPQTNYGITT